MSELSQKYNIICLSNQLWDFPNWTNKRHIMSRLAGLGNNVLFVDPPINIGRVFIKQLLRNNWSVKRFVSGIKKDPSGVTVASLLNFLPFPKLFSILHILKIKSVSEELFNSDLKTILWVYHVELEGLDNYLTNLNYNMLIYDCVDNYEGFPSYNTPAKKEKIRAQERFLTKKAHVVFATAPGLVDKLKTYNKNVFFTPNVGDYEKFKNVKALINDLPDDLNSIPRPRVGFVGSLDNYKFDNELMKKIALENPKVSFVLIGQMALKDKRAGLKALGLDQVNNLYFLGYKDYKVIQNYYAGFDAYIIPYRLNDYTVGGCFPVKFHDALAAGLPTVVTDLPAYAPFKDVAYISKTYDEFSQNVRRALEEDSPQRIEDRQLVAKENDWNGKAEKLLSIIGNYFEGKN